MQSRVMGCIDAGRAGAADPDQDLASRRNTLGEFGAEAQRARWAAHEIAEPGEARLQFHLCLDEPF